MKQKIQTLAFVMALLRTELDFFLQGKEGDGALETKGQTSKRIKHFATPQFLMHGSSECFPYEEPALH